MTPCLNQPMTRERDNFKEGKRENELAVRLKQPKKGRAEEETETELYRHAARTVETRQALLQARRERLESECAQQREDRLWQMSILQREHH